MTLFVFLKKKPMIYPLWGNFVKKFFSQKLDMIFIGNLILRSMVFRDFNNSPNFKRLSWIYAFFRFLYQVQKLGEKNAIYFSLSGFKAGQDPSWWHYFIFQVSSQTWISFDLTFSNFKPCILSILIRSHQNLAYN